MKQCNQCGNLKQFSDFSPHRGTRDGYNKKCLACLAEAKNMTEDDYVWHYLTKLASRINYYTSHKDQETAYAKETRKKNPEQVKQNQKAYRDRNPVIIRELGVAGNETRKRRMAEVEISDFTNYEWKEIKEAFNNSCAYCGCSECEITIDHVIPISRGGNHTKSNIVPACRSCNSKKHNKTLEEVGMRIILIEDQK